MLKIANIACQPSRFNTLEKTVESLYDQVDCINIYMNEFKSYPDWIHKYKEGKIICYKGIGDHWNLTDNGKFYPLTQIKEPCYYFGADSDIVFPNNYVQHTIELIEKYRTIITYHGRILKAPVNSYYKGHQIFDFRGEQPTDFFVHVGGSGVMAFRTDYFNPKEIYASEYLRMSDLVVSLEAKKQGKKIICAAHKQNWIIQQEVSGGIRQMFNDKNEHQQIELARLILE